jgi:hypothetical protein
MLLTETGLVLVSLLIAITCPSLGSRWFEKLERGLLQLSRHRTLSVLFVGALALAIRALLLPVEPIPQPTVHDEFSYFLMSDTFAHGRVANPTHPMWSHLEATYVNQRPTYVSKYFPGQGVLLAIGQVAFGHPFWGVWLSVGVMCAVLCWMLQGWFSPFWALLGTVIAMVRLGTFSYWANSYFGGALPAIGGALVLGALPRIQRRQRVADSLLMGCGLVILAGTRPLEGLIFSFPVVIALLLWIWKNHKASSTRIFTRVLAPGALILAIGFAAMFYYFWRTTGSPFRTPYQVNLQNQDPVPLFPWQPLRPVSRDSAPEMRALFFGWEIEQYDRVHSHFVVSSIARVIQFYLFFFGPALTLPFLMLGAEGRPRWRHSFSNFRLLFAVFWVSAVGLLLPTYYGPSYAAALTCVVFAFLVAAMQSIRRWHWHGKSVGLTIVRAVPLICFLMFLTRALGPLAGVPPPEIMPLTWCSPHVFDELSRAPVQAALESQPGPQLALVRYRHDRVEPVDWVQNLADIDRQKVVWANDLGPQQNQELLNYYKDRKVWLVEPDKPPPQISPYPTFSLPVENTRDKVKNLPWKAVNF